LLPFDTEVDEEDENSKDEELESHRKPSSDVLDDENRDKQTCKFTAKPTHSKPSVHQNQ